MNIQPPDYKDFGRVFHDALLAWSRQGTIVTALAAPPLALPANIRIISATAAPLKIKRGRRTAGNLMEWPQLKLHAKPNPFFAFVLDGVVDLSVGVTERMQAENAADETTRGVYHLRLPRQSLLVYPSHVPTSDGTKMHWEEQHASSPPDSAILWVDIIPEGAILHTCRTQARSHTASPFVFIFDTHLFPLTETIIEELKATPSAQASPELVRTLLHTWLLRIARGLTRQSQQLVTPNYLLKIKASDSRNALRQAHSPAVERACGFIEGHLNLRLTVEKIAGQAFVSPAQLNRLFRAELQQSVMEYVSGQRLVKAKSLLSNTTLPVRNISDNLGIHSAVYFSRMFRKQTGMTPLEYRFRHR